MSKYIYIVEAIHGDRPTQSEPITVASNPNRAVDIAKIYVEHGGAGQARCDFQYPNGVDVVASRYDLNRAREILRYRDAFPVTITNRPHGIAAMSCERCCRISRIELNTYSDIDW